MSTGAEGSARLKAAIEEERGRVETTGAEATSTQVRRLSIRAERTRPELSGGVAVQFELERFRQSWEQERSELRTDLGAVSNENRILKTQILTLQQAVDNREAELERWKKWGDAHAVRRGTAVPAQRDGPSGCCPV